MTNMIFYVLLLALATSFSSGAMRYSGVNRTFMLLQRAIMEYSVITCDEEHYPYYDQDLLKRGIDDYFKNNLPRYVNHYKAGIYYMNDDESFCMNNHCHIVQVSLYAKINYFYAFNKAMVFTISSLEDTK